mgnify:CR=1 FL=1
MPIIIFSKDVQSILGSVTNVGALIAWDGELEADRIDITKWVFSDGRRFYEITKLFNHPRFKLWQFMKTPRFKQSYIRETYIQFDFVLYILLL